MSLSVDLSNHDPDRLLQDYCAARAQETLFELRGGAPTTAAAGCTGYDEFTDGSGEVRPAWRELADLFGERGREGADRPRTVLRGLADCSVIPATSAPCATCKTPVATSCSCTAAI